MRWGAMLIGTALLAQVSVPRPAPELKILQPAGRGITLSDLRGHVVLLAFVLTGCAHCQAASRNFERLRAEYGPRGFEVLAAAMNEDADPESYTRQFGLRFPVGVIKRADALRFLGVRGDQRIGMPQIVLIDRAGIIRGQSAPEGSPMLQSEEVLRELIGGLVSEGRRR